MSSVQKNEVILTSTNKLKLNALSERLNKQDKINNIETKIKTVKIKPLVEQPIGIKGLIKASFHRLKDINEECYSLENGLINGMFDIAMCIHKYQSKDKDKDNNNITTWKYKAFINFESAVKLHKKYENIPEGKTIGNLMNEYNNYPHDNWQEPYSISISREGQLRGALDGLDYSNEFLLEDDIIEYFTNF